MSANEIVYVLANPAMPGLVKIGKTTQEDVKLRMNQLYTTGVPVPFECVFAIDVGDCSKVESALHIAFGPSRINPNREFFKIDPEQAIAILKLLGQKEITTQVSADLNIDVSQAEKDSAKKLKRRPRLNFLTLGIPVGAKLLFKDNSVEVEVKDGKKVIYNEKIMTLTEATREVMELDYSVQPSPHWTFEGRLLKDIYDEAHDDEDNT